uniref:Uncharacterized protein n=1 Tax=Trichinella nativa TaxID=6335 RepID=A0A0V1KIC3_9BILA
MAPGTAARLSHIPAACTAQMPCLVSSPEVSSLAACPGVVQGIPVPALQCEVFLNKPA